MSATARSLALVAVVFIATLAILLGLSAVMRPSNTGGSPDASVPVAVGGSPGPSGSGIAASPTPARPTPSLESLIDPVIAGAGDIAGCDWDDDTKTADLLRAIDPAVVFTAGDNVYPRGLPETYRDCFDGAWGSLKDRLRPAAGNHDWESGSLDAYLEYFGAAATNDDGDPWYAYDLGTWRVIVLDSDCDRVDGCGPDSDQGRWLAAELAADRDARCTLAIWHRPRFSSGQHGNDDRVGPFWEALHRAGADVVVTGHDHDYERFAPQDPAGVEDRDRGIRQFVVGTGGVALRPFESIAANSELRASLDHGVLALTLRDGSYDWHFSTVDVDFSDRGTATCH